MGRHFRQSEGKLLRAVFERKSRKLQLPERDFELLKERLPAWAALFAMLIQFHVPLLLPVAALHEALRQIRQTVVKSWPFPVKAIANW